MCKKNLKEEEEVFKIKKLKVGNLIEGFGCF